MKLYPKAKSTRRAWLLILAAFAATTALSVMKGHNDIALLSGLATIASLFMCDVCIGDGDWTDPDRSEVARLLAEIADRESERADLRDRVTEAEAENARLRDALRRRLGTPWPGKSEWWADVAALMNDRADMWEQEGNRPCEVRECRGLANAFRTYAEGVGIPQMDTLRRKRREAEAKVARVEAICKDTDGAWLHGAAEIPIGSVIAALEEES